MKRILTLLLCVVLSISFVGCSGAGDSKKEASDNTVKNEMSGKEETTETEGSDPLQVYYVNQASSGANAEAYVNWYKLQDDALEIETKAFASAAELEEAV